MWQIHRELYFHFVAYIINLITLVYNPDLIYYRGGTTIILGSPFTVDVEETPPPFIPAIEHGNLIPFSTIPWALTWKHLPSTPKPSEQ